MATIDKKLLDLFADHLSSRERLIRELFEEKNIHTLVISSGEEQCYFQDDVRIPYRAHAFFRYFCPLPGSHHYLCWKKDQEGTQLLFYQPDDFWHVPHRAQDSPFSDFFKIQPFSSPGDAVKELGTLAPKKRWVFLGDKTSFAALVKGSSHSEDSWRQNPTDVTDALARMRMKKTPWEVACLQKATHRALLGHKALYQRFLGLDESSEGGEDSERDLYFLFQRATGDTAEEFPYPPIIAVDEHSSYLHYDQRSQRSRGLGVNLLVDAGVQCYGYASDISRTYLKPWSENLKTIHGKAVSLEAWDVFAHMLSLLEKLQQQMVSEVRAGVSFRDLHHRAVRGIFHILEEVKLVKEVSSADEKYELSRAFFPHGLGHMLGLQVHDVHVLPEGVTSHSKDEERNLRFQSCLEENQVITIEPGIYFIPKKLSSFSSQYPKALNDKLLQELICLGGMRIEDDVLVGEGGAVNLTREEIESSFPELKALARISR